jgi:hypothetical protein
MRGAVFYSSRERRVIVGALAVYSNNVTGLRRAVSAMLHDTSKTSEAKGS